jgi:hypothetical protein
MTNEFKIRVRDILPNDYNREGYPPIEKIPNYYFTGNGYGCTQRGFSWWDVDFHNPSKTVSQFEQEARDYLMRSMTKERIQDEDKFINDLVEGAIKEQKQPVFYTNRTDLDIQIGDELKVVLGRGYRTRGLRDSSSADFAGGYGGGGALKLITYEMIKPSFSREFPDHFSVLELLDNPVYMPPIKTLEQKKGTWQFCEYPYNLRPSAISQRLEIKDKERLIKEIEIKYKKMRELIPFTKEDQDILANKFPMCKSLLDRLY